MFGTGSMFGCRVDRLYGWFSVYGPGSMFGCMAGQVYGCGVVPSHPGL